MVQGKSGFGVRSISLVETASVEDGVEDGGDGDRSQQKPDQGHTFEKTLKGLDRCVSARITS